MAAPPRVTVGVPTWNRLPYLRAALESVMAQGYPDLEIVVSDNASSDGTAEYLASISDPRVVRLLQPRNIGGIPNLNACLERASGELFLLLSDDDLLYPHAIARLASPFFNATHSSRPDEVGLSWCPCQIIDASGRGKWATQVGPAVERPLALLTGLFSGTRGPRLSSVMVRTDDARRVGGYNLERYDAMCDTSNWGAASLPYQLVVCVSEPLVAYRTHASSHTGTSLVNDWRLWGARMHDDLLAAAQPFATRAELKAFSKSRNRLMANQSVDILMRHRGSRGWFRRVLGEIWRSRRYLVSLYTFRRLTTEGWKLLR